MSEPPHFDACHSLFSYQFPVSALLQDCKYGSQLHLARTFALLLARRVSLSQVDTVIPMPMHAQRLKERCYNQALEMAKLICAEQISKLDYLSVTRQKHRPPQVSLAWQAQLKNIKGVFKVEVGNALEGKHIAIVDDVMTTGASLNELAKTLKHAGASHVECWIVARSLALMFTIVLFEPEIPPNTGNIIRLCANTGAQLHLIKPLGFKLEDKQLKRAGLDYHEYASLVVHENWSDCKAALSNRRIFAITTKGSRRHSEVAFQAGDVFVFGPETRGLPAAVLEEFGADQRLRLPMLANSRSLNLSNSAAVLLYEAWRQIGFTEGV